MKKGDVQTSSHFNGLSVCLLLQIPPLLRHQPVGIPTGFYFIEKVILRTVENKSFYARAFVNGLYFSTSVERSYDELDEKERLLFKQAIRAFEGVSPTYRLELLDRPTIVWEFNSLMQALQLMINLMLSDENNPVKICKKCGNAFIPKKTSDLYCSRNCMSK